MMARHNSHLIRQIGQTTTAINTTSIMNRFLNLITNRFTRTPVIVIMTTAVIALTLCGIPTLSQAADLDAVLQQLDHPAYVIRQDATHTLLADQTIKIEQFIALYTKAKTPEQRHRLTAIMKHHLIRQIRLEQFPQEGPGSIGIRQKGLPAEETWPQKNTGPVILVEGTYPGFPAYTYLLPGDLIIAVNDQRIAEPGTNEPQIAQSFGQLIKSHATGEQLSLTLIRNDQTLTVTFALANLDALNQMYTLDRAALRAPFSQLWLALENHMREITPPTAPLPIDAESFDDE